MTQVVTSERKQIAVRGFQMLIIGIMMNMGLAIIGFLAFVQFLWLLVTNEKNAFISTWDQALGFGTIRLSHFCLALVKTNLFLGRRYRI